MHEKACRARYSRTQELVATPNIDDSTDLPTNDSVFFPPSRVINTSNLNFTDHQEVAQFIPNEIDDGPATSASKNDEIDDTNGEPYTQWTSSQDLTVLFQGESSVDPPLHSDHIRVEYHPHSGRTPDILDPEEFKWLSSGDNQPTTPLDDTPWLPFRSREDFEFAELAHTAALNKGQIDRLVKFIKKCEMNPGSFTFEGFQDVESSWKDADKLLTPVRALRTVHLFP